jgi:lipopolysaccharide biosynthesis glycosyltransferase
MKVGSFLLLALLLLRCWTSEQKNHQHLSKVQQTADEIHIALAVDSKSAKDALIVASSVVLSAFVPENMIFHVVTTGVDLSYAEALASEMREHFTKCLPNVALYKHFEVQAFVLPKDRGFGAQLERKKTVAMGGSSHWNSDSGADMVRFYLPEIFPHLDRILYIDNDVIISCCIEEVWSTPIPDGKAVGIALDDLKWATTTQFQRHYNASHPTVYNSIRRTNVTDGAKLSEDEFSKALPRYPNDGVLLFDVKKYNNYSILKNAEEVAMLNNKDGIYVVGLGTQQFTVLSMHDKW